MLEAHASTPLRTMSDVQLALSIHGSRSCRALVISFELAIRHLKPFDVRTWSAQRTPLFVILPSRAVGADHVEHLLRCGVSGFLRGDTTSDDLSYALKRVMNGELWLSRRFQSGLLRRSLFRFDQQFTPREREILERIAAGDTNLDIAERLFITRETVRWHLRCIYTKLGVHNRKALVEFLNSAGWLCDTLCATDSV